MIDSFFAGRTGAGSALGSGAITAGSAGGAGGGGAATTAAGFAPVQGLVTGASGRMVVELPFTPDPI